MTFMYSYHILFFVHCFASAAVIGFSISISSLQNALCFCLTFSLPREASNFFSEYHYITTVSSRQVLKYTEDNYQQGDYYLIQY